MKPAIDTSLFPLPNGASDTLHLIVLVHGIYGTPSSLEYIQTALRECSAQKPHHQVLVHLAQCNLGHTTDGVEKGGSRLAEEVNAWLDQIFNQDKKHKSITLSLLGNSLGGLYARYALSLIDWNRATPAIFCTTCTPHLGVSGEHTYLRIGSLGESVVAQCMGRTGRDLFRKTTLVQDLAVQPQFVDPLKAFQHRLTFANAYNTDFQVPCSTAAFLSRTESEHWPVEAPELSASRHAVAESFVVERVETKRSVGKDDETEEAPPSERLTCCELATRLDNLGWTKIFCDVRRSLWAARVPFTSNSKRDLENSQSESGTYTSHQLWETYGEFFSDKTWHLPMGHSVMIVNSQTELRKRWCAGGKPIVDALAAEMIHKIIQAGK